MSATVCVFAKPPLPGQVKTRLAEELGEALAAELAACFWRDTWEFVSALPWARAILATTDEGWGRAQVGAERAWVQGSGDLGQRMERVLSRALRDTRRALALGADTPGIPRPLLEAAQEALATHDAVLGPSEDGGFYVLGLGYCPSGLLADLPWSSAHTFDRTLERLAQAGLTTAVLPGWFDVDRPQDLWRLDALLRAGSVQAPATQAWLSRHSQRRPTCQ